MCATSSKLAGLATIVVLATAALSGCSTSSDDTAKPAPGTTLNDKAAAALRNTYATSVVTEAPQLDAHTIGNEKADGFKVSGWQSMVCGTEKYTKVKLPTLTDTTEGLASDPKKHVEAHASILVFKDTADAKKAMSELLVHPRVCKATGPRESADENARWTPLGKSASNDPSEPRGGELEFRDGRLYRLGGPGIWTTKGPYVPDEAVNPAAPAYLEQLVYDKNVVIALDGVQSGVALGNSLKAVDPVMASLRARAVKVLKDSDIDISVALDEPLSAHFTN